MAVLTASSHNLNRIYLLNTRGFVTYNPSCLTVRSSLTVASITLTIPSNRPRHPIPSHLNPDPSHLILPESPWTSHSARFRTLAEHTLSLHARRHSGAAVNSYKNTVLKLGHFKTKLDLVRRARRVSERGTYIHI